MRIAKYISHSGYCSRRNAEKLINEKKVKINSIVCQNLATKVSDQDTVKINNHIITLEKNIRLWYFYKPVGIITSSKDPQGRKTVFDLLPKSYPRLITIGRLDINSEGLLLFTNNGDLARYFELPKNNLKRKYRVRVNGKVSKNKLLSLRQGIRIDNISFKPIKANLEKQMKTNAWINMTLSEGKNREIRKICSYFGWRVNKLIRINYGKFSLGNLKPGQIKEVYNHSYHNFK